MSVPELLAGVALLLATAGLAILGYLASVALETRTLVKVLAQRLEDHLDEHNRGTA